MSLKKARVLSLVQQVILNLEKAAQRDRSPSPFNKNVALWWQPAAVSLFWQHEKDTILIKINVEKTPEKFRMETSKSS